MNVKRILVVSDFNRINILSYMHVFSNMLSYLLNYLLYEEQGMRRRPADLSGQRNKAASNKWHFRRRLKR